MSSSRMRGYIMINSKYWIIFIDSRSGREWQLGVLNNFRLSELSKWVEELHPTETVTPGEITPLAIISVEISRQLPHTVSVYINIHIYVSNIIFTLSPCSNIFSAWLNAILAYISAWNKFITQWSAVNNYINIQSYQLIYLIIFFPQANSYISTSFMFSLT